MVTGRSRNTKKLQRPAAATLVVNVHNPPTLNEAIRVSGFGGHLSGGAGIRLQIVERFLDQAFAVRPHFVIHRTNVRERARRGAVEMECAMSLEPASADPAHLATAVVDLTVFERTVLERV